MKLNGLQALRFFAAFAVMQSHVVGVLTHDRQAGVGAFGVDVFFVISGFIITRTAKASAAAFLTARGLRILPSYYVATAGLLVYYLRAQGFDWQRLAASLTLWPAYEHYAWPYLTVAWSLCFEALFYLAFAAARAGVQPGLILLGYIAAWVMASLTGNTVASFLGAPISLEFLFGVGLALYAPTNVKAGSAALIAASAAFTMLGFSDVTPLLMDPGTPSAWARPLVAGVPAALLVYGVLQIEPWCRGRFARALSFLGDTSYALYLTHLIVIAMFMRSALHAPPSLTMLAGVVGGIVFYLGVERPIAGLVAIAREGKKRRLVAV